ncbi:MAG: sigma factor-like helix-turn-helix DNA-binding protein [Planctomycetota bacterium]
MDNEQSLIESAQAGNTDAYDRVVALRLPSLRVFVAMRAPVPHLIDEIVHETFVFAFFHLHDFVAGSDFLAWLHAIAGNLTRQARQRFSREQVQRRRYAEHQAIACEDVPAGESIDHAAALGDCIQHLSDKQRALIMYKYSEDLSAEDIAGRLGQTIDWVYVNLHRLRHALKNCIESKLSMQVSP